MERIKKKVHIDFDRDIKIKLNMRELITIRIALGLSLADSRFYDGLSEYGSVVFDEVDSQVDIQTLYNESGNIMEEEGVYSVKEFSNEINN
ncbi:hypothetical protein [Oceanobacillus oncorhynchi]|uniref:hypothetical protein n=1 Tax=Oceanobacillus oncorhynchi TaxID=545501 RepID=UPI0034D6F945